MNSNIIHIFHYLLAIINEHHLILCFFILFNTRNTDFYREYLSTISEQESSNIHSCYIRLLYLKYNSKGGCGNEEGCRVF